MGTRDTALRLVGVVAALLVATASATVLDDYVNAPDSTYRWELANTVPSNGYTIYVIKMVSQTWLSYEEIDRPVWEHWLKICVPDGTASDMAVMYINGGGNPLSGTPPSDMESFLVDVSVKTKLIVSELEQIPNQPIRFADEDFGRSEDAFLAKTWDNFIKTRDGYQIGRLPMVKASVRAVDTMIDFVRTVLPRLPALSRFGVAGGSKRGWTTWLHGAVDPRVVAIVPCVIEVLQMGANLNFEWQVYGRWPVAFKDYTDMNVTRCLNCPIFNELAAIEDPYYYLDRFVQRRVPILSVSSVGDEFFLPDGYQWWYFDYPGEKYLGIQPNAEHSLFNRIPELSASLSAFIVTVERHVPRPAFSWTLSPDGSTITVHSVDRPVRVLVYEAYNERSRAFILNCYLTCFWRPTELFDQGNNTYVASVEVPTQGYRGFFIELYYQVVPDLDPLVVTTGTSIVPQALPYPPCPASVCAQCDTCNPLPADELAQRKRFQPY